MIPVVLFVYNRHTHLKKVLKALQMNNIELLYVFSDAPGKDSELYDIARVREIIDKIDWVDTKIIKHEKHKGVAKSIIEGVSDVLDKYKKIIVLEDDCVPSPYFYSYMCQCLEYYEKEKKIFCVSAYACPIKQNVFKSFPYDVFFWGRFWSWGWGTWQRAWEKFNPDFMDLIKQIETRGIDTSVFGEGVSLHNLKRMSGYDTWATPFFLNMVLNKTLSVHPVRSYISNIGFDGSGSSCTPDRRFNVSLRKRPVEKELRFPIYIKEDAKIVREIIDFINGYPQEKRFKKLRGYFSKIFK